MGTLLIGVRTIIIRLVILHTHGKRLARNIVRLDPDTTGSGTRMIGGREYRSTRRKIVLGRRFANLLARSRC
jgi:carbon starvation protein CstA